MRIEIKPVWVDINGKTYYDFSEIDDRYLTNIINFCKRGRISKQVEDISELCEEALIRGIIDIDEYEKICFEYRQSYIHWKIRDDIKRKQLKHRFFEEDD